MLWARDPPGSFSRGAPRDKKMWAPPDEVLHSPQPLTFNSCIAEALHTTFSPNKRRTCKNSFIPTEICMFSFNVALHTCFYGFMENNIFKCHKAVKVWLWGRVLLEVDIIHRINSWIWILYTLQGQIWMCSRADVYSTDNVHSIC